jgi:hypothetical protein
MDNETSNDDAASALNVSNAEVCASVNGNDQQEGQ